METHRIIMHVEPSEDLVGEEFACPTCGNRVADTLILAFDGETVRCDFCGREYTTDQKEMLHSVATFGPDDLGQRAIEDATMDRLDELQTQCAEAANA